MTPSDMVKLAYRNVGLCTTLYPNHESVLYINCTRNVLDPAFETNQMVQLAQFFAVAAEGFAKILLGVTASFVLVVGGITCVLAAPCAAAAAVIGEVLGPILSPELIGLPAVVIGGGVAVAEIRVVAMLEARLAAVEVPPDPDRSVPAQETSDSTLRIDAWSCGRRGDSVPRCCRRSVRHSECDTALQGGAGDGVQAYASDRLHGRAAFGGIR